MSKFENLNTGIVVSVDDSKDDRFTDGWKPASAPAAPKTRKPAEPKAAE